MTRAVPRGPEPFCHGISANVAMSGIRYWSLSAIRVKPSIELPSNHVPCLTEPSSWWIGIVTALTDADDVGELELDEADAARLGRLDLRCGILIWHWVGLLCVNSPGRVGVHGRAWI